MQEAQAKMPPAGDKYTAKDKVTTDECLFHESKVYLLKQAPQIKLDLPVTGHCGPAEHKGHAFTSEHVKEEFTWRGITDESKTLVSKLLHCQMTKSQLWVTREHAHALHSSKQNEILHFDYLYMHAPMGGKRANIKGRTYHKG